MFGDKDRKGPDLRGTTWQNDSTWGSGYHSTLTRVILYFFWPCYHPPTSLFSPYLFWSQSQLLSIWLCVRLSHPSQTICVCAVVWEADQNVLLALPHKVEKEKTKTKQSKAKQSKTHLSLHWQHIKVTDWSLLKAINHHGCTPGKTPGWPWLTCTAMQLQKI